MTAATPCPSFVSNMLELAGLACSRGGKTLFKEVSVAAPAGTVLRIEGKNGAGKTTLLRTLCGLSTPAKGEIRWNHRNTHEQRDLFCQQFVYLGHAPALKDDLTAVENLQSACDLSGNAPLGPAEARAALGQSGLTGKVHLPVRSLSQGQRKRVALARLLLGTHVPLWILDEPLNALDVSATQWVLNLVQEHVGRGGIVVLTSHQALHWNPMPRYVEVNL